MLFRKKHVRSCSYCKYGTKMDNKCILCAKHGIVNIESGCFKFSYDPCKRIPLKPRTQNFIKYNDDDFSL